MKVILPGLYTPLPVELDDEVVVSILLLLIDHPTPMPNFSRLVTNVYGISPLEGDSIFMKNIDWFIDVRYILSDMIGKGLVYQRAYVIDGLITVTFVESEP